MSAIGHLIAFGIRQVLDIAIDDVRAAVEQRFTDHSQTLPRALARANERSWQAVGVALAGDGFLDRVKVFFASGDDRGIREQVRLFLQDSAVSFDGSPAEFRDACLRDLKNARKSGLLAAGQLLPAEIARQAAAFRRHADAQGLVAEAHRAVAGVGEALVPHCPHLGKLLLTPPPGRPPLLAAAFAYFFRREVETDDELAHGLFFDGLRQLAATQAKAFGEINKALADLGESFNALFESLGRIETAVVETHGAVLDLQAELQRLGGLHLANAGEVRALLQAVLGQLGRLGMQRGEVRPQDSFSIRGEDERRAVKALLERFRGLSAEEQGRVPALLNGLGKLQVSAGDFEGARKTFGDVVRAVGGTPASAEARHNAYRAALEQKKFGEALTELLGAAALAPERFAPFPLHRYQPRRILGAGGFGTAFLSHDRNFDEEVVVKALHTGDLERGMADVFREARILRQFAHPAIIGVRDCEYADPAGQARPYVVMDYFPGSTLEDFVRERGALSPPQLVAVAREVGSGMREAHARGILHRDLKPANVLVRKEGERWLVKIIDFGLALRRQTIEASMAAGPAGDTVLSQSVAGTLQYAPPEQLGRLPGVKAGPYSDVYAFGKLCCYALFKTTEPRSRHFDTLTAELRELLERCLEEELEYRHPSFDPVLAVLNAALQAGATQPSPPRNEEQAERERLEQQAREAARLLQEGEDKLARLLRAALERAQGRLASEDKAALRDLCERHGVHRERAREVAVEVRRQWQQDALRRDIAECDHLMRQGQNSNLHLKKVAADRLALWKEAAEQGVAEAQWLYADCLLEGIGVRQDVGQAAAWFRKAAEQGLALAQKSLGNRYLRGQGVRADQGEAFRWYSKAAAQGEPASRKMVDGLAEEVRADLEECDRHICAGQNSMKYLKQVHREKLSLWKAAAAAGVPAAQWLYGDSLLEGIGVAADVAAAVGWFRKAAEQGLALAQMSLGNRYLRGQGVPEDEAEALKWYRKAAAQGHAASRGLLKRLGRP